MGTPALSVRGLCKRYGATVALADVSFTLQPGDVLALVGANGAGKSTLIKILATLLQPDQGELEIMGTGYADPYAVRRRLGYMPDVLGVYEEMLVAEYLDFFARAHGISESLLAHRIAEVTTFAGLEDLRQATCGSLSRGYQQRLALARAMLGDPSLYLMDEPASGLDPIARADLRQRLQELRRRGKTILISSHVLADLQEVSSHVAIIEKGHLQVFEPMADFLRRSRRNDLWRVVAAEDSDGLFAWLGRRSEVRNLRWAGASMVFELAPDPGDAAPPLTDAERVAADRGAAGPSDPAPARSHAVAATPAAFLKAMLMDGFLVEQFAPVEQGLETAYLQASGIDPT